MAKPKKFQRKLNKKQWAKFTYLLAGGKVDDESE